MNTSILMSVFFRLRVKFYVNPELIFHKTKKQKDKNKKQNHDSPNWKFLAYICNQCMISILTPSLGFNNVKFLTRGI